MAASDVVDDHPRGERLARSIRGLTSDTPAQRERRSEASPAPGWGPPILRLGRNCWRIERAERFGFLVDAKAYFDALASSIEQAKDLILIVGWDIHTKTVLRPDSRGKGRELWGWLQAAVEREPRLRVHLLEWDFSMLYAFERDWTPVFRRAQPSHSRLHFQLDSEHPWSASQHQKIVIIDDAMAYVGGIDLTVHRWDTPEHLPDDPRRRLPSGATYGPFHDVQVALEGPAARALAGLARQRWKRATDQELPTELGRAPWPTRLPVDFSNVDVAIARTLPAQEGQEAVREVEQLYLDAIAATRQVLYIETQYFTLPSVTEAIERRLLEEDGPEVVLVVPEHCPGWLEQNTIGVLRSKQLQRLTRADRYDRFRAVAPFVGRGGTKVSVTVHAKVLVVDDRLVRVGSSNVSRRSMGFDSECDVAIEASRPGDATSRTIRSFRNRLLAEHLGISEKEVEQQLRQGKSVVSLIDTAGSAERGLAAIDVDGEDDALVLDAALVDPNCPEAPGQVAERFFNDDVVGASRHPWIKAIFALAVLLALAAAWKWTPLNEWVKPDRVAALATRVSEHELAPAIVIAVFILGSVLMVPLTALLMATALTFGFWAATAYSLVGSVLGGLVGFGAGRWLGRDTVRRVTGSRLQRASQLLARRGLLSVIAVRLLPVAPFTIANLIVGASHIRLRDFVVGSAIALLPGIVAINLFETNLRAAISNPSWGTILLVVSIPVVGVLLLALLRRALENLGGGNGS